MLCLRPINPIRTGENNYVNFTMHLTREFRFLKEKKNIRKGAQNV